MTQICKWNGFQEMIDWWQETGHETEKQNIYIRKDLKQLDENRNECNRVNPMKNEMNEWLNEWA